MAAGNSPPWIWASPILTRGMSSAPKGRKGKTGLIYSCSWKTPPNYPLEKAVSIPPPFLRSWCRVSTILCTKHQLVQKISPTTSFPAGPHAVLGLEVTFFISITFLTHFLPDFFKTTLSWGPPVLTCKVTMGFLIVCHTNHFHQDLPWQRATKLAASAYWKHLAFDVSCLPLATPWIGEVGMKQAVGGEWGREKKWDLWSSSGLHCVPSKHSLQTLCSLYSFEGQS